MNALADLLGELSWSLKATWIVWGTWIAFQVVWRRRARVEVSVRDASVSRLGDRLTLGLAGAEGIRVTAQPVPRSQPARPPTADQAPQSAAASVIDATLEAPLDEPAAPPRRPRRRRQSPRSEPASAIPA